MRGSREKADAFESRPLPRSFVLELTRRCNHRCSYCYTAWGAPELAYPTPRGDAPLKRIGEIVARLQDEAPVEQIALSGGEPLLHKDLARIASLIADRGITPVIITNGSHLTAGRVEELDDRAAFEVTLLSHRREIHDRLTGRAGSWDAAVEAMVSLTERERHFVAAFIATSVNAADVRPAAELAIALGAQALMYNRMNLGAFNRADGASLLPSAGMVRQNLEDLDDLARTAGFPITVSVVIEPCVIDVRRYEHLFFGWCPNGGEGSYFTIDPDANVRICNHSPTILGNLTKQRFTDIYYHHPYVRRFRDTLPAECATCEPELRNLCGGGCKAAAEQCYGTIDKVDPFVTLRGNGVG